MKTYLLAACLGFMGSLTSAQASGPNFMMGDEEPGVAAETAVFVDTDQSRDATQTSGILAARPILHLDSRYGDIAVETIFGKVNGARLHVTW